MTVSITYNARMKTIRLTLIGPRAGKTAKVGPRKVPFVKGECVFQLHNEQMDNYESFFRIMTTKYGCKMEISENGEFQVQQGADGDTEHQVQGELQSDGDGSAEETVAAILGGDEQPELPAGSEGVVASGDGHGHTRVPGVVTDAVEAIIESGEEEPTLEMVQDMVGDDDITQEVLDTALKEYK